MVPIYLPECCPVRTLSYFQFQVPPIISPNHTRKKRYKSGLLVVRIFFILRSWSPVVEEKFGGIGVLIKSSCDCRQSCSAQHQFIFGCAKISQNIETAMMSNLLKAWYCLSLDKKVDINQKLCAWLNSSCCNQLMSLYCNRGYLVIFFSCHWLWFIVVDRYDDHDLF